MTEGWIGVTDQWKEGTWQTATKENLPYTYWAPGEPNNSGNEDCAYQLSNTKWNDQPCSSQQPFICQFKGITYYSCQCLGIRWYQNAHCSRNVQYPDILPQMHILP